MAGEVYKHLYVNTAMIDFCLVGGKIEGQKMLDFTSKSVIILA